MVVGKKAKLLTCGIYHIHAYMLRLLLSFVILVIYRLFSELDSNIPYVLNISR